MIIDFNEIPDHRKFEDLAVSYFEDLIIEAGHGIVAIEVNPSGVGVDGGRDILVTLIVSDSISIFKKRWVVQCKFHNADVSTDKISDINIPTLIHSYNASGYLLILREKPTSKLTELFERLEKSCRFEYKYAIWSGEQFKKRIMTNIRIVQQYFPKYFEYLSKLKEQ